MVVDAALVSAVAPDEVPYPEPLPEPLVLAAQAVQVPAPPLAVHPTFDPIIRKMAAEKGVDPTLVRAMIQVESAYQPRARSNKGANRPVAMDPGAMQFTVMPSGPNSCARYFEYITTAALAVP